MVDTETFVPDAVAEIGDEIGDANAVIALSGGVDSSVAAHWPTRPSATDSRRSTSTPA